MESEPKWRRFEKLVAKVQQELAPNAVVTHDDHIKGHDSEKLRQVDITVKQKIGQYEMLIAIDCKDYKIPIDVKDIEQFTGLIKDIRANKGVMVAANGFTDTAKHVGEKAGLDLYRLVDAEAHDWQTFVAIPILCDFRGIKSFQFAFHTALSQILAQMDPRETIEIVLYDMKHEPLGRVVDLLKASWDSNKLPSESGEHRDIILTEEPATILYDDKFFEVTLAANIIVERRLFFGHLPLIDVKGFVNEYTGQLLTRGFTTGWLDIEDVEKNWRRLEAEDEIAVIPLLKLQALDCFAMPGTS